MLKTKEESIRDYKEYVDRHVSFVQKAFEDYGKDLIRKVVSSRTPRPYEDIDLENVYIKVAQLVQLHDKSKYEAEELDAYAARFNPYEENTDDATTIRNNFEIAWEHHYNHNPHHPEFWAVTACGKAISTHIPNAYFVEMLCDWIAMSMNFKSSTADWWFNDKGGKAEKYTMMPKSDIELIDEILKANPFDFSNT